MIILIFTYIKPLAEVDKVREAHKAHYKKIIDENNFIASGRQTNLSGGICMIRNMTKEQAEKHAASDPYVLEGVARCDVYEFDATMLCEELS